MHKPRGISINNFETSPYVNTKKLDRNSANTQKIEFMLMVTTI